MQFTKMQGIGNDFVVVDACALPVNTDFSALAVSMCNRHLGVGADGLLAIGRSYQSLTMRMFNPDGSEDVCGNGLRCAALWAFRKNWTNGDRCFHIVTRDGSKTCQIVSEGADGRSAEVEVEMSRPLFDASSIPMLLPPGESHCETCLNVAGMNFHISPVNTGSTHIVIFGPEPSEEAFQKYSPLMECHPRFPERTSIMWTTVVGYRALDIRIWERGAGETLGCGTGACAAAVAYIRAADAYDDTPVKVKSKGGVLSIRWDGVNTVYMTGPAASVYTAHWQVEN
jgi:diaminopimelate epimerase